MMDTQPLWSAKGNILSIENQAIVYKGTPFYDRLTAEGRLGGDYIDCTYRFEDPKVRWLCRLSWLVLTVILPTFAWFRHLPAHLTFFVHTLRRNLRPVRGRSRQPQQTTA